MYVSLKIWIPFTEVNYVSEVHQITKQAGPHYDGGVHVTCVRELWQAEDIGLPSARRIWPATWSSLFHAKYSS